MSLSLESTKISWRIDGESAPVITAIDPTGSVTWETNRGSVLDPGGLDNTVELSMPNQSWYGPELLTYGNQAVKITATDDTDTVSIFIDSYAKFPFQADWAFQSEIDEDVDISVAEDESELYRIRSGLKGTWSVVFKDRERSEFLVAQDFRAFHGKTRWFFIDEKGLEELQLVRFDSAFSRSPDWADGISYGFTIRTNDWKLPSDSSLSGSGLFGEIMPGEGTFGG